MTKTSLQQALGISDDRTERAYKMPIPWGKPLGFTPEGLVFSEETIVCFGSVSDIRRARKFVRFVP